MTRVVRGRVTFMLVVCRGRLGHEAHVEMPQSANGVRTGARLMVLRGHSWAQMLGVSGLFNCVRRTVRVDEQ